jgi:signal transduction histidine kinase
MKYQFKKNEMIRHEEELRMQFQQTLLQTQLEIQEQTLQKLSFEIHDNIGQVLSLVKLQLARMDSSEAPQLKSKIDDVHALVAKVMQDIRSLSHGLNSDYVTSQGLMNAVKLELDAVRKAGAHEVYIEKKGIPFALDTQKELILFRIVQEALHNAIRHAKANLIRVDFVYIPGQLKLVITDNGEGFDSNDVMIKSKNEAGLGIKSMHNRASLIGATYDIDSAVGKGTIVTVTIPE